MISLNKSVRSQKKRVEQIHDGINAYIKEHGLKAGDRIPTEAELCTAFGVSRPLIREALRLLEQERLVITKHGIGRFVTAAAALNIARPITVFESISSMLSALGHNTTIKIVSVQTVFASTEPDAATALGLPPEAEILVMKRFRDLDGEVLVYSVDVVPLGLIGAVPTEDAISGSINALLANLNHRPVMSSANVAATFLPAGVLPEHADPEPWLLVTETCLSELGIPVLWAQDYHRGSKISFNFSRQ